MTKNNCPPMVDFWAQAHFKGLVNPTPNERHFGNDLMTSVRARDFERVITNVIRPLLRDFGKLELAAAYGAMAEKLHDVALCADPERMADFPPDGGKQLILDRLDTIETMVRGLKHAPYYFEISTPHENICVDFRSREERRAA